MKSCSPGLCSEYPQYVKGKKRRGPLSTCRGQQTPCSAIMTCPRASEHLNQKDVPSRHISASAAVPKANSYSTECNQFWGGGARKPSQWQFPGNIQLKSQSRCLHHPTCLTGAWAACDWLVCFPGVRLPCWLKPAWEGPAPDQKESFTLPRGGRKREGGLPNQAHSMQLLETFPLGSGGVCVSSGCSPRFLPFTCLRAWRDSEKEKQYLQ